LHVGACAAWLIGGPFLIAAGPTVGPTAALAVYVGGMIVLFGTSAAFHRVRWSAAAWRRMRRADHSAIFIGIAATSTAVSVLALQGWAEILLLALVWTGALVGITLRQVWLDAPQWVVAVPYVVVGWCPLIVLPQLLRGLGPLGFSLTLGAGVAYTAGAVVYAMKRPDPWPRVFGFHEVFHACTLVGAALFAAVVVFVALPRADGASRTSVAASSLTSISGAASASASADGALGVQASERVLVEPELDGQHVVGVLAEPGHAGLGPLGHLGELHR
jgi:hemolysin III